MKAVDHIPANILRRSNPNTFFSLCHHNFWNSISCENFEFSLQREPFCPFCHKRRWDLLFSHTVAQSLFSVCFATTLDLGTRWWTPQVLLNFVFFCKVPFISVLRASLCSWFKCLLGFVLWEWRNPSVMGSVSTWGAFPQSPVQPDLEISK